MAKRQPLQTTFESGVLTPLMYGRTDLDGYRKGLKDALNMVADTRGPMISRPGSEYLYDIGDPSDRDARLFTYRASYSEEFVVAITPTFLTIVDSGGVSESSNLTTNGGFLEGSTGWTAVAHPNGSVIFTNNKCAINSGDDQIPVNPQPQSYIEQQVTGLTGANVHRIQVKTIPISAGQIRVEVGTTQGANDLVNILVNVTNGLDLRFTPNSSSIWIRLTVSATLETIDLGGPEPVDFWANFAVELDYVYLTDYSVSSGPSLVTFPSVWAADDIPDIQFEMAPDLQRAYIVHRNVPVQELEFDPALRSWSLSPSSFTDDPLPSGEYPGAITFFQGRLWIASTYSRPTTLWASKPGRDNYNDFGKGAGNDPSDSLEIILARNCDIQWIRGSKVLYVGADNSEHIITSDGPIVTAADTDVQQKSAYGSARIDTNWVSNMIAYVTLDRRRLRVLQYDSNTRNMDSRDLTIPSEHLTLRLFKEIHHAPHPINRLWAVMQDGSMLTCTFQPEANISSWSPHAVFGKVKSITVVEEAGASAIHILVLREDRLRLCRILRGNSFMDEYVNRSYPSPTNTIDELEHLEGQTVKILGDGAVYPDEVVSGGTITVDGPAVQNYVVGLSELRMLETLPIDSNFGANTTAAAKKGWNRIFVRLLESALPLVNGVRAPDRSPLTPMDTPEPLFNGSAISSNLGWDYDGTIKVEQDLPYNLSVTGIYGELSEEMI